MLFDHTSVSTESIRALTEQTIARGEEIVQGIVDAPGPRTFASTMAPLEEIAELGAVAYGRGPFAAYVHPDGAVRDVAREAEATLSKWSLDLAYREDLYAAVREYADTEESAALEGERRRFLEFTLRDFRLAGMELDEAIRQEIQQLRQRLVELEVTFQSNIAEYDDALVVVADDLAGLPESYIQRLSPGEESGTFRISMDYPDIIPFFDNSPRRDLREELSSKFNRIAADTNGPVLREAIELRARIAAAFGQPSWAHYRMQEKMAQRPEAVKEFYAELIPSLTEAGLVERSRMETMLHADGHDGELQSWDRRYYHTRLMKEEYGVDPLEVAAYFPLERVLEGLFDITQQVFGLEYEEVGEPWAWHDDVTLYAVKDADSGELIGHFYMDLFPREGKYNHAAAFPLVPASRASDGTRRLPVSAIVANLTRPTADQPSLLQHDEVVTLFHEFGHILHMTLSTADFSRFSAATTEWDFVEAPSQIMENWCWRANVLAGFARHHASGDPIPNQLVERLTAARNLNVAMFNLSQIRLGRIDMDMHDTLDVPDPLEVEIARAPLSLLPHQEGTFATASFGHLLGGYDAGYYGYLWAQVFGHDMFSVFAEEGVLSAEVGRRYRREILEPNGTRDAIDLLRNFLDRDPSNEAFLTELGIKS